MTNPITREQLEKVLFRNLPGMNSLSVMEICDELFPEPFNPKHGQVIAVEEREFWLAKGEFPFYEGYPVDSGCKPNARAYDKVIKVREILE